MSDPSDTSPAPADNSPRKSNLGKRWVILMVLYIVGLNGFAVFCLYDAMIAYPRRGASAASFNEYRYLNGLAKTDPGSLAAVNISDPAATLDRLGKKPDLIGPDQALNEWLTQLKYIGKLTAANTSYPRTDFRAGEKVGDPGSRLAVLRKEWEMDGGAQKEAPSPLTVWDIPSQWLMLVVCGTFGLITVVTFLRARTVSYAWDPATHTLTLPGGAKITPADIEEVDKRKWHKLYVHLRIKPFHPTLGGKEIEFDLRRYEPVEDWILAMEEVAFPGRAEGHALAPSNPPSPAP